MSGNKGKLSLGINLGETIQVGTTSFTLVEIRGKQQIQVQIEAPLEIEILRVHGTEKGNPVQGDGLPVP